MLANFLNDQSLKDDFTLSFAYGYSELYEDGLNKRVFNSDYNRFPLRLMKQYLYEKKNIETNFIFKIVKNIFLGFYIFFNKYFSIGINSILLYHFFRQQKIDILHINNGGYPAAYSCYSAVFAGRLAGIKKIIYVVNNTAQGYKHPLRWFDYPLDFVIKKCVTVFITGSEYAGARLISVLKLSRVQQITINNGINRRNINLSQVEFKEKYGIPQNRLLAITVANLEERKGHLVLLEAILKIKAEFDKNDSPFFVLEGSGPEKSNIVKYIEYNSLEDYVVMIEYIPDIFNLINASDFVILPSITNEDFPNIILEAMSLGKPVIGSEIAGIPEQIDHQKTGMVVKPQDSDDLKRAIIMLCSHPDLLNQYSHQAKEKFDKNYNSSISITKYKKLYNNLL